MLFAGDSKTRLPEKWQERCNKCVCVCARREYFEGGFKVFMVVSMKMAVFWVVVPCRLVEVCQRFRGPCHQDDDSSP
jgi:hypothetical protein